MRRQKITKKKRVDLLKYVSQNTLDTLRQHRKLILILVDVCCLLAAYLIPWALASGRMFQDYQSLMISSCFFFVCCYEIVYGLMGMYDSLWRYAEIVEFFRLCLASVISVAVFVVGSLVIFSERRISISVYFLSALFATSLTLYSRLTYRMYRNVTLKRTGKKARRTMVIGAGTARCRWNRRRR